MVEVEVVAMTGRSIAALIALRAARMARGPFSILKGPHGGNPLMDREKTESTATSRLLDTASGPGGAVTKPPTAIFNIRILLSCGEVSLITSFKPLYPAISKIPPSIKRE